MEEHFLGDTFTWYAVYSIIGALTDIERNQDFFGQKSLFFQLYRNFEPDERSFYSNRDLQQKR